MLGWGCLGGTGGRAVCWGGGVWVGLVVGQCDGVGVLGGTGGRAVCWGGGVWVGLVVEQCVGVGVFGLDWW